MKTIGKKIIAGTIAASFLIGGAAIVHNQAYADTAAATTAQAEKSDKGQKFDKKNQGQRPGFGFRGGVNVIQQTATILGAEESAVKDSLKAGKTLAELVQEKGMTLDEYVQKLAAAETKAIDAAVTEGKLTQEQADKMKTGLTERLTNMVQNKKPEGQPGKGQKGPEGMGHKGMGPGGFMGKPEMLTQILGITQEELKAGLTAGKSIAELAQEKGIGKDELIAKLKDNMTEQLTQFVDRKGQPGEHQPRGDKKQGAAGQQAPAAQ